MYGTVLVCNAFYFSMTQYPVQANGRIRIGIGNHPPDAK